MSVPKKRQASGRSKRRRAHHALSTSAAQKCPNCKKPVQSHRACPACGYYGGAQKVKPKKTKSKSA